MEQIIDFNINKIDFQLKKLFENVYTTQKNNKSINYFQINANKLFLFENCQKRIEVKVFININELYSDNIKWSYATNPLNENSEIILRTSHIDTLANDIYEIAIKRKMINEYFSQLDAQYDLINDNNTSLSSEQIIENIINKYTTIINKNTINDTIVFETKETKLSNKFLLEKEINNLIDIKMLSYKDNTLILIKNAS
jgi:alpha-mannosidase